MAHSLLSDCTLLNGWLDIDHSPRTLLTKSDVFFLQPNQDDFLCKLDGLTPPSSPSNISAAPVQAHTTLPTTVGPSATPPTRVQCLAPLFNLSPLMPAEFQSPLFADYYNVSSPWITAETYISPIVRASSIGSDETLPESPTPVTPKKPTFLDQLRTAAISSADSSLERPLADAFKFRSETPVFSLLSPCKALLARPTTPNPTSCPELFSPLTPLTPLTPAQSLFRSFKATKEICNSETPIIKAAKRKRTEPDSPTPQPRPKNPRRALRSSAHLLQTFFAPARTPSTTPPASPQTMESPLPSLAPIPIFTNRTFPSTLKTSSEFPLFYRRFPASSFFQTSLSESPCALTGAKHPGGTYNAPRWALDLYTPRFVKGKGVDKVGLCPICVEPSARGGAGRKVWLAMKFSAFKCYHMQYAHGISAATGLPYSPPADFRITPRPNAGKNERTQVKEAKCHKCKRWVPVEGTKAVEMKVKEIFWWKHAALCHHASTLDGEGDVYEQDAVYGLLSGLDGA